MWKEKEFRRCRLFQVTGRLFGGHGWGRQREIFWPRFWGKGRWMQLMIDWYVNDKGKLLKSRLKWTEHRRAQSCSKERISCSRKETFSSKRRLIRMSVADKWVIYFGPWSSWGFLKSFLINTFVCFDRVFETFVTLLSSIYALKI